MPTSPRRKLLPAIILNLILWIICGLIIIFLDPEKNFQLSIFNYQLKLFPHIVLFLVFFTLALVYTLSIVLHNRRRSFILTVFIVLILIFQVLKIASWWLVLTILIITAAIELFLTKKRDNEITS